MSAGENCFILMCVVFVYIMGASCGFKLASPESKHSAAHYYCGSHGGVATVNNAGDRFVCVDGRTYRIRLELINENF